MTFPQTGDEQTRAAPPLARFDGSAIQSANHSTRTSRRLSPPPFLFFFPSFSLLFSCCCLLKFVQFELMDRRFLVIFLGGGLQVMARGAGGQFRTGN